jgi:hypothetical protein
VEAEQEKETNDEILSASGWMDCFFGHQLLRTAFDFCGDDLSE